MASLNCFLALSVRKHYYPIVRATPYQVSMLFRKIDVISVMNCFHELITLKVNTGFSVSRNPTRCNSMQIFIYCKATLHVSGVTEPIIRTTKNCNRSLWYRS